MNHKRKNQGFFVVILGVIFEHFDMMIVSLLSSLLAKEFIGESSPSLQLLYAYIGYAIAFLFRPLGAFIFGYLGDAYSRRRSLMLSMILMSFATLSLYFIPSRLKFGFGSTALFLLCRIAQGLAVGGEYGTAMTYSYELDANRRTFYGALVVSSTHIGGVMATFLASLYIENFKTIFLIGGLLGFLIVSLRSFLDEKPKETPSKVAAIAAESVKDKGAIYQALIVASMIVLVFYGSLFYLNEMVHCKQIAKQSEIFRSNTILLGLWIVIPPLIAFFIDKFHVNYRKVMLIGAVGVLVSAPLLGASLCTYFYPAIFSAQILLHLFHMLFCLCTPRFFADLFPVSARNTSVSTTYSLSASLSAALAPMLCHVSCALFNTYFAICLPFMVVALASIFILKKERIYAKG